jgi:predicted Zn-dependent protease
MTMTSREQLLPLAEIALQASPAEQTEVLVAAEAGSLTRFASNRIHQNVHETSVSIRVRAVIGKRIGVAEGNDPSPQALQELAARAAHMARNAEPNGDFVSLPGPSGAPRCLPTPAPATVNCSPEQRAAAARQMIDIARERNLVCAGQVATGHGATLVCNSLGVESYWESSRSRMRVVMQGPDSSGFAEELCADFAQLDAGALGRRAADKAVASAGPRELEPGAYTVILEPLAVEDMIATLALYDLHALAHQEGRSFTTRKMGQPVCGSNISLWDDGCDPRGLQRPFDYEGVPRQRVDLIKSGVLVGVTYDSFTAGREPGAVNTGHALPPPNTWGPVPMNLFLSTGEHSVEDMIAATDRGVLVTRFHYTNMVHPVHTVFTGMTRDGTFLVEKGQVVGGIKNMRFTQSILEALSHVDMIGREGCALDWAWVPALRIEGFHFSSTTRF